MVGRKRFRSSKKEMKRILQTVLPRPFKGKAKAEGKKCGRKGQDMPMAISSSDSLQRMSDHADVCIVRTGVVQQRPNI